MMFAVPLAAGADDVPAGHAGRFHGSRLRRDEHLARLDSVADVSLAG
jgi:hypothetical protein